MAKQNDLTLSEVLADPMILALASADGWSKAHFRADMTLAAREIARKGQSIAVTRQSGMFRSECECCA